jgi:hypothetical protein
MLDRCRQGCGIISDDQDLTDHHHTEIRSDLTGRAKIQNADRFFR